MVTTIQLQYVAVITQMLGNISKEDIAICINVCTLFDRTEFILCV